MNIKNKSDENISNLLEIMSLWINMKPIKD